jgi:diguanylate cyclase (GGDEF)-like protein
MISIIPNNLSISFTWGNKMTIIKNKTILLIFLTILVVYGWNLAFYNFELISVLGTSIFPIIVGLLSCVWSFQTYLAKKRKDRYVWFIFSIGLATHVIGNIVWLWHVVFHGFYRAPNTSYLLWLIAYFIFLLALTYYIRALGTSVSTNAHLFNTAIFFIVFFVICIYYLVQPYWASAEDLFQLIVIGFLYPVVDISILYVVTILYYLSRRTKEKMIMLCLVGAFVLQVIGDALTAIMKTNQEYYQLFIEPMWVGSLLLIGIASLYAKRNKQELSDLYDVSIYEKESTFPYMFTLLLILLMYQSYEWEFNPLSLGLGIVIVLIIIRQLMIIRKNKRLMLGYRELAYQDALTGLPNRSSFKFDLEHAIQYADEHDRSLSVLVIDLDRFKMVNDTLGHFVGDQLLQISSQHLQNSLDTDCSLYRLGGDEFVVLLRNATMEKCKATARSIMEVFNQTFHINYHEITITPSVGISTFPANGRNLDSLFKAADAAMYKAKANGSNNFQFYDMKLKKNLERKMIIESELRKAFERDEFQLFYQPKINLATEELMGMEALLRWNSNELGLVSPEEFIPIAEETGLIGKIGEWVLYEACKQTKDWQNKGFASLCISVNVSVQQFKTTNLVQMVEAVLEETSLSAEYLELEITESIMQDVKESKRVLSCLRELGVSIALDDFGTGYSSLHLLKNIPINTLKIDKAFIDNITDAGDQSMVKGIIDIAHNQNLEVVAEGIEHAHQVEVLTEYHCDYGQGYYYHKPISATEFERLLMGRNRIYT